MVTIYVQIFYHFLCKGSEPIPYRHQGAIVYCWLSPGSSLAETYELSLPSKGRGVFEIVDTPAS